MLFISHALHDSPPWENWKTNYQSSQASRWPKQSCLFLDSHKCCLFKPRCCKFHQLFVCPMTTSFRTPIPKFHKRSHGGPERLSSLPKVMQPASDKFQTRAHIFHPLSHRLPSTSSTCLEVTWGSCFHAGSPSVALEGACDSALLPTTWVIIGPRTNVPHHAAIITGRNKAWSCASEFQWGEMMV